MFTAALFTTVSYMWKATYIPINMKINWYTHVMKYSALYHGQTTDTCNAMTWVNPKILCRVKEGRNKKNTFYSPKYMKSKVRQTNLVIEVGTRLPLWQEE